MKSVEYINREYVPSVDLQTLDKTFNTLETGHKEAVKAASDLQVAMANLDLNEKDEWYRQQKINEIQQTIADNTVYGNSFGALDDIVMKAGDLGSDAGMIGRLNSQKNFKAFQDKVDKMAIPEGMKEMYKEANPYHYEDGPIDERTGKVTKGKLWEATDNPVATVPIATIQQQALKIAAEEAGTINSVSFLDANGKEVYDASKSADGLIYKKVGGEYHRLSKEKLNKAFRVAIDSIPGAADSLRQDHRYAKYEYNKLAKKSAEEGGNPAPFVEGVTDKNGNVYDYDDWLDGQIDGFARLASYNRYSPKVDYGGAFEQYAKNKAARANGKGSEYVNPKNKDNGFGATKIGFEKVSANAYSTAVRNTLEANNRGLNIIKSLTDEFNGADSLSDVFTNLINTKKANGPGSAANYFIKLYKENNKNASDENIKDFASNINKIFMGYYASNKQKNAYNNDNIDSDALKFSADIANGEFKNDNKYGAIIIERLNKFYELNEYADFTIGKNVMNNLFKLYGINDIQDLREKGFEVSTKDDESYNIKIGSKYRNELPEFAYNLKQANNMTPGTFFGWLENRFAFGVDENNYHENSYIPTLNYGDITRTKRTGGAIDYLGNAYESFLDKASSAEKDLGISNGLRSINAYSAGSYAEMYYKENGDYLTEAERKNRIEQENKIVDDAIALGNISSGSIKQLDENNNFVSDLKTYKEAENLIHQMYTNSTTRKDIVRLVKAPSQTMFGEPQGYVVSFTVPKEYESDNYKAGQQVTFMFDAPNIESVNYNPSWNPTVIAENAELSARAANSHIENKGYDENLGNTTLYRNKNGGYISQLYGVNTNLDRQQAVDLTSLLLHLDVIKSNIAAGIYTDRALLNNSYQSILTNIANIIYKDNSRFYTDINYRNNCMERINLFTSRYMADYKSF